MKTQHILIGVLVVVVVYYLFNIHGCKLRCSGHREGYSPNAPTGICADAAGDGADSAFVASYGAYQKACGEASASVVVHQLDGEYGLNSDMADSKMSYLVASVATQKCCDPNNQDAGNCTGN